MIPVRLEPFRTGLPVLEDFANWRLLRKWTLSEVYRAALPSGETRIVKWGGREMAGEADVYRSLLQPLGIRSPRIFASSTQEAAAVLIMVDIGPCNLEQQPRAAHFLEAARELARLRAKASSRLKQGAVPHAVAEARSVSAARFLDQLDRLIRLAPGGRTAMLRQTRQWLPEQLTRLERQVSFTLVHHDYHAKNLLAQEDRIMPIDWSNAYLSPHLGDLYCLVHEAEAWTGVSGSEIMQAFAVELDRMGTSDGEKANLGWQVNVGGLCWLIRSLHWLAAGGTAAIPGSEAWIPDLLDDMGKLLSAEGGDSHA